MDTCMHMFYLRHVIIIIIISFNSTIDNRICDSTHQQKVHNDINTTRRLAKLIKS